jgi:hypothetical protein
VSGKYGKIGAPLGVIKVAGVIVILCANNKISCCCENHRRNG